ncbi:hypothetical protein [Paraburkholderia aromaticivorans]|uniref:hypothetical protein n=1 Tax=Paraburkholderia aromaticivorans TaxID=2026199 RepID=UPI0012FE5CFF|nr:hypothetical protein [Paraburkholderia aromaticivorans]
MIGANLPHPLQLQREVGCVEFEARRGPPTRFATGKAVYRCAAAIGVTVTGKTVLDRMPGISYRSFWQTNYKRFIRVTCRGSGAISDMCKKLREDAARDFPNIGECKNSASRRCGKGKYLIRQLIVVALFQSSNICEIFILVIQKARIRCEPKNDQMFY